MARFFKSFRFLEPRSETKRIIRLTLERNKNEC